MKHSFTRIGFLAAALLLVGQGCISFRSSSSTAEFGMWKSIDGGQNWEKTVALPTPAGVGNLTEVEVHEMVIDPSDRLAIYVGTISHGLFFSYDGGASWQRVREPLLREGRIRGIAIDPSDKCTVYVSRGQRLLKTTDCGRTFNTEMYVDSRSDVVITDVEVDWFNANVVYLVNTAGEVLRSNDGGVTWQTKYRNGGFLRDIELSNTDSRILLAASAQRGVHRSADGGETWSRPFTDNEDYKDIDGIDNVKDIVQTDDGGTFWISTDRGLLYSLDRGVTWATVDLITPPEGVNITAIAVDPKDGDHVVYIAGQTIYVTLNRGDRWDTEKMPVSARAYQLLIDDTQNQTLYMGLRPFEQSNTLF